MNYDQFNNLSCYEEFEIQCALLGVSKVDVLKEIGHQIGDYYFFVSLDGLFNWFDLNGNHVKDPGVLKEITNYHTPQNLTKCIIPNSVISIGYDAFYDCESLTSITIPNSVKYIDIDAFYGCESLTSITIPNSVTRISIRTFTFCKSLKEVIIPDSVKYIDIDAFYGCESLTSITIPNSVKYIGTNVFFCCNSLKEVVFKGKTLEEVKQMENYPFGIVDESIIKVSEI